jgi:Rrf2 family iron-sulfur cluster assembly transcriptional regulator
MITKKAEYAITILSELASHPEGTVLTSKAIANKRSIPVNLVVQLTSILKEAGWATGTRGPSGGIKLTADPDKISLRQVIETVDGQIGITRCLFNEKPCRDQKHCSLRAVWDKAQSSMLAVLEGVTIKELARSSPGGRDPQ